MPRSLDEAFQFPRSLPFGWQSRKVAGRAVIEVGPWWAFLAWRIWHTITPRTADGKRTRLWQRVLTDWPEGTCFFDHLMCMGLFEVRDGDWYVNGRLTWKPWETFDRWRALETCGGPFPWETHPHPLTRWEPLARRIGAGVHAYRRWCARYMGVLPS